MIPGSVLTDTASLVFSRALVIIIIKQNIYADNYLHKYFVLYCRKLRM